jgi:hypothetical protein
MYRRCDIDMARARRDGLWTLSFVRLLNQVVVDLRGETREALGGSGGPRGGDP